MHQITPRRRDLTAHYCLYQIAYFAACSGFSGFAVAYLLGKGFTSSQIGVILAMTNVFSCVLQPLLGSYADRRPVSTLSRLLVGCIGVAFACAAVIEVLPLARIVVGGLYLLGGVTFSLTVALCNSLCACYAQRQYPLNYGIGAGVGSASFSFASLAMGYVLSRLGARAMMMSVLVFLAAQMALVMTFPRLDKEDGSSSEKMSKSLSVFAFARRYRYFMLTLLGVMLMAGCHIMAENFMIHLFTPLGGSSENVGTALFIACITAAPFLILFENVQRRVGVERLMRMCGIFYMLKCVLMILAPSIRSIYLIVMLQMFTYGFLFPCLYYFARERIAKSDVSKGQTVANAMYTLGVALGNSIGGAVIDLAGVKAMLLTAAIIALTGGVIINVFIGKKDL